MGEATTEIWLARHGETEWSLSGAHTSRTDIDLTEKGREQALQLKPLLEGQKFSLVLTSPRRRARETCRLAGFGEQGQVDENLAEWDYGVYEGRTTAEIRKEQPGWSVWSSPIKDGETLSQVASRAQSVVAKAMASGGKVLVFSHAHFLRILAACWTELPAEAGSRLALSTGSISVLAHEHDTRVIQVWNRAAGHEGL